MGAVGYVNTSVFKLEELMRLELVKASLIISYDQSRHSPKTLVASSEICFALENKVYLNSLLDIETPKMMIQLGISTLSSKKRVDCLVKEMAFNGNSQFLVLSDSLGSIHFVLAETCQIVFSQDLSFLRDQIESLDCTSLTIMPDGYSF